jgi:hypothetical protein
MRSAKTVDSMIGKLIDNMRSEIPNVAAPAAKDVNIARPR